MGHSARFVRMCNAAAKKEEARRKREAARVPNWFLIDPRNQENKHPFVTQKALRAFASGYGWKIRRIPETTNFEVTGYTQSQALVWNSRKNPPGL